MEMHSGINYILNNLGSYSNLWFLFSERNDRLFIFEYPTLLIQAFPSSFDYSQYTAHMVFFVDFRTKVIAV